MDGGLSEWGPWSPCPEGCYTVKSRSRTCTNPAPAFGGQPCRGHKSEDQFCSVNCLGKWIVQRFCDFWKVFDPKNQRYARLTLYLTTVFRIAHHVYSKRKRQEYHAIMNFPPFFTFVVFNVKRPVLAFVNNASISLKFFIRSAKLSACA